MKYLTKGEDKENYFFVNIDIKEIISQVKNSIIFKLQQQFKSEGQMTLIMDDNDFIVTRDKVIIKFYKVSKETVQ